MATYYISPSGVDSNPGTLASPRFSLASGMSLLSAGDTLYCKGGTYQFTGQQNIISKNGSSGNLINVWAYPGETPVFTRSSSYTPVIGVATDLIYMETCSYIYFKGIEISNYSQHPTLPYWFAFRGNDLSNCKFENINYHHNGGAFTLRGDSTTGNLFLNCDFHHNQDPYSTVPYDGADGLNITFVNNTAATNTVRNCRAWWNADDGFDFWQNEGYVLIEGCWAFYNGYIPDTYTTAGNGSGIKLGPCSTVTTLRRTVQNCVAFKNRQWGIVENESPVNMNIYNNTCIQNGTQNFLFGFWPAQYPKTFKNNISYDSGTLYGNVNHTFGADAIHSNNTWDSAVTVTYADFLSSDDSALDNARFADGTLPEVVFLKLANGSDLKNAGTNVGLSYNGAAPDMGAFESTGNTYFLATSGNDTTGSGTLSTPWFSLNKAWTVVSAGDIIYMRGGTYTHTVQQYLTGKNGSAGNMISIRAYPGEAPVITRGVTFDKSAGYIKGMVFITANYLHIYKVRFTGMTTDDNQVDAGLYLMDVNNSIFEQIECDNNVSGLYLEGSAGSTDNLFLNSDFHDNYSNYSGTNGGNSDGLGIGYNALTTGTNTVRGCRAWNNGDDGFDSFQCFTNVVFDNCWSWHNGFVYGTTTKAGNGCGFKLGSDFPHPSPFIGVVKRRMQNCLAWDNGDPSEGGGAAGAHINEAEWSCEIYNCTFYNNGVRGINFDYNSRVHYFRNVICFNNGTIDVEINDNCSSLTCSYTTGGISDALSGWTNNVTSADFVSTTPTGVTNARNNLGALPNITFLTLASGSDLIDTGTNVSLPYVGTAPDRGAFEYGTLASGSSNASPIALAGLDQTITLPTSTVTLTGSGSDSDGTIVSYAWTQVGGTTATITSPSSQSTTVTGLTTSGTRTFRLTVTDNNGATGSDDTDIVVQDVVVTPTSSSVAGKFLMMAGIIAGSKVVVGGGGGLTNVVFTTLTNLQQSPTGSWIPVDNNNDAGGRAAIVLNGDGFFQAEIQSAQNTDSFAINLDVSNSLAMPYWGTARYVLFPKFGNYWYNDDQAGGTDSGIAHQNGDLFRITRTAGVLKAQYYRGSVWTDIGTFTGTNTSPLYFYIASAQDGTALKLLNPKQTGAV